MNIKFNEKAISSKQEDIGRVVAAFIDKGRQELTHIVVEEGTGQPIYVPINAIERWTDDEVLLRLDANELANLPPSAQPHGLRLSKDTMIEALDAPVGKIGHILANQYTYQVTDFLVHQWAELEADTLVSMTYVTAIEPDRIKLGITKDEALTKGEAPAAFYVPVEGAEKNLPAPRYEEPQPPS